MKILVMGAGGMLGNTMIRVLNERPGMEVFGTARADGCERFFSADISRRIISGVDVENHDLLIKLIGDVKPDCIINCVGLVKQMAHAEDPLAAIPVNSIFPHRLARLCAVAGARLVHISTDCVFSGETGRYSENSVSDARDVYGRTKFLGEVNYPHAVTLRTSIIGHELQSAHGLLEWFLKQGERCRGYTRAIFSGLPTVVLAQIVRDIVIPRPDLSGLYHVAAKPISKYELLGLIARVYGKAIEIIPDDTVVVDRSLDPAKFKSETGYVAPEWSDLVKTMHSYR